MAAQNHGSGRGNKQSLRETITPIQANFREVAIGLRRRIEMMKTKKYDPYSVQDHVCYEPPLEKGRLCLHASLIDHHGQKAQMSMHINQPHHEEAYKAVVATSEAELRLELRFLELSKEAGLEIEFENVGRVTSYDPGYSVILPRDPDWIEKAKSIFCDRERVQRIYGSEFKAVGITLGCAGCHEELERLGGFGSFHDDEEKACTPSSTC